MGDNTCSSSDAYRRAVLLLLLTTTTIPQCLAQSFSGDDPLIVQTTKGRVRGMTVRTAREEFVDAFLGIPYAQPPIGKYRFRHPKPIDPWKGIFNATQVPNSCVQINDTMFGDFKGSQMWNPNSPLSEDCLTVSVWVPKPRPKNAAILVWLYGGGFYSGTTTLDVYDTKIITAEERIITVSINYRVASLGFLYFDRPDVPGNAGMFDQLMALEWIRDNIANFGGNPHNVTIFGESAGAVSASLHLLSPLSRNLFSQVILQSGSAVAPWGVLEKDKSIKRGLMLAEKLGCPYTLDELDAVVACLLTKDPVDMVNKEWGDHLGVVDFPFVPVVDGSFLDETPAESLESKNFKKTNIIAGSNTDEGTYFIIYFLTDHFKREEDIFLTREDFEYSVKRTNPDVGPFGHEAIQFEYTDWKNPEDTIKNRDAIDRMVGDYQFICPVNEFSQRYAETGNDVYMYYFSHRSTVNPWPRWMGVMHGDEINFALGEALNPTLGYTKEEEVLSRQMMRYWANFAKTGNPSQRADGEWEPTYWPVHTPTGREYLTLAVNSSEIGKARRARQCTFWKEYLPKLLKATASDNPKCRGISRAATITSSRTQWLLNVVAIISLIIPAIQVFRLT